MPRNSSAITAALAVALLNAIVLLPFPLEVRFLVAYVLAVPVLGFIAISALQLPRSDGLLTRIVLSFGLGYSLCVIILLILSYLPGGLRQWHTLLAIDIIAIGALAIALLRHETIAEASGEHSYGSSSGTILIPTNSHTLNSISKTWLWLALASLIAISAFLRLPGLSYSEFHDDEASVVWHSAEVIQGREDALFIHDKGPAEILVTTAIYSMSDRLSEQAARLPFAIANIIALLAVFWLGSRLFNPVAGWAAAMVLAVDGYFIAFSRIVQYQSIVFLMVVLCIGMILTYYEKPQAHPVYLYLAAAFFATGVLSHYEAVFAAIPAGYLLLIILRRGSSTLREAKHWVLVGALVLVPLLLFYVPFTLHPQFASTFTEITGNRIGSGFPYNNLEDFFTRTIIYSSTYYFAFLFFGLIAALLTVYHKVFPKPVFVVTALLLIASLVMFFVNPGWLQLTSTDYAWLVFVAVLAPAILGKGVSESERAIWLWFSVVFILSLFFVQKPRTHVYGFFIPMAFILGSVVATAWRALERAIGRKRGLAIAIPTAATLCLLFAVYGYWLFVYNQAEVLRTWQTNRPTAYWTPLTEARQNAIYGFPFKNGWKVVGSLYADGTLDAPFARNGDRGVANWYTRGVADCARDAKYFVYTPWTEPTNKGLTEAMPRPTQADGYQLIHIVSVNGEPRLEIFERSDTRVGAVQMHDVADYESSFDRELSSPLFEAPGPAAWTQIDKEMSFRFGENIWLRGYTLQNASPRPKERVDLTLYWEADSEIDQSYKVFTQVIDRNTYDKAGQRDGIPACGRAQTDRWLPGDTIVDRYSIVIRDDALPGDYSLLIGMYDSDGERLDIFSGEGQLVGQAIGIDTITVTE